MKTKLQYYYDMVYNKSCAEKKQLSSEGGDTSDGCNKDIKVLLIKT